MNEWISVKDRLPENGNWVLVTDGTAVDINRFFDNKTNGTTVFGPKYLPSPTGSHCQNHRRGTNETLRI